MVDTTGFFDYPTEPHGAAEHGLPTFLDGRSDEDWMMLLDHSETRVFRPGELVLVAGEQDRALYLLVDGWVRAPSGVVHPITTVGEGAFLDGAPRAVSVEAMTDGEMQRLSYEGFEALAARNPALGRDILLDVGRILAARLRTHGRADAGVDGLMADVTFPNYTQISSRIPLAVWQGMRAGSIVGALIVAALLVAVPETGLFVMWKVVIPTLPAPVSRGPRCVAQPVPARRLQPDAARAEDHEGADRAEVAEGVRLRDRVQPVRRLRRAPAPGPRRQRPAERAAAPRRDDRRLRRRDGAQGQERLVLDDLPAAARSSASTARRRSCSSPTSIASRASAA